MRNSIVSMMISVIIMFVSLIVLPLYFISVIDWRDDMNTIQSACRNFVDEVVDVGQITDQMVADMNLQLASCSSTFNWKISKKTKVTNPDPDAALGATLTTWQPTDCNYDTTFSTGDIIIVEVNQVSQNLFQRLSALLLGSSYNSRQCRLAGMVR